MVLLWAPASRCFLRLDRESTARRPGRPWTPASAADPVSPALPPRQSRPGPRTPTRGPRPPPQRLLLRAQVRQALSLARLWRPPTRRLRTGHFLGRHHKRHSAASGSSGGSGGGLAGQKQYFGGPRGRTRRRCYHHHGQRLDYSRVPRHHRRPAASSAAPGLSRVVAVRDWLAPRDAPTELGFHWSGAPSGGGAGTSNVAEDGATEGIFRCGVFRRPDPRDCRAKETTMLVWSAQKMSVPSLQVKASPQNTRVLFETQRFFQTEGFSSAETNRIGYLSLTRFNCRCF